MIHSGWVEGDQVDGVGKGRQEHFMHRKYQGHGKDAQSGSQSFVGTNSSSVWLKDPECRAY
jgi:hypothetical protein